MTYRPAMVTAIDGRQVLADSELWRSICEAVWTLNKPHVDRDAWLASVEKKRGADGRRALEDEMARIEPAYLLAMASRDVRRAYLDRVSHYFGQVAREHLEQRVVALWEQRKAAQAA